MRSIEKFVKQVFKLIILLLLTIDFESSITEFDEKMSAKLIYFGKIVIGL